MGDIQTIQKQLVVLMKMYKEDKITAEQQHNTLAAKFEQLSNQVTATRQEPPSDNEGENSRRDSREKHRHDRRNNDEKNKSFVPKFSKLDFPIYDGKSDHLGWLNRCEHFFHHQHTHTKAKM